MTKIPVLFVMHPVGDGPSRAMNVLSTKLWIKALVEALPDVAIAAPWITYAEVMVDRDRGMRDAFVALDRSDAAVAVGGDFTRGMREEWEYAGKRKIPRVNLTKKPMPGLLTYETFVETRTQVFRDAIRSAFYPVAQASAA